jgi:hypothetical protein
MLHQFDPFLQEWTNLTNDSELGPSSRFEFGFTAANKRAYVFGGSVGAGNK